MSCCSTAMTLQRTRHCCAWSITMGAEPDIKTLPAEIKMARGAVEARDARTIERVDELEHSIDEILLGMRRPGGEHHGDGTLERKRAVH
jgi:hypothetical protein